MTMRGRPAAPLEKALARGSDGAEARAARAPTRVEGAPKPPSWLTPDGLECWIRVSELLFARGQLSLESGPSLTALCQCYAEWVELARDLNQNGRTYKKFDGVDNVQKPRPEVAIFADTDRRFKGWLNEFGLTDATRGKVVGSPAVPPPGDDPLAAYGLQ